MRDILFASLKNQKL